MTTFADSSALVKLYIDEQGHEEVRAITTIAVCHLARVEVASALWSNHRAGRLSTADVRSLRDRLDADWIGTPAREPRFDVVAVGAAVVDHAAELCGTHGLRGYDAVQLASGCAARAADPGCATFAVFDARLKAAAAREGFAIFPA